MDFGAKKRRLRFPNIIPSVGKLRFPSRIPSDGKRFPSKIPSVGYSRLPSKIPSLGKARRPIRIPSTGNFRFINLDSSSANVFISSDASEFIGIPLTKCVVNTTKLNVTIEITFIIQ